MSVYGKYFQYLNFELPEKNYEAIFCFYNEYPDFMRVFST